MSFEHLGLTPELLAAVADQGYEHPTPVQAAAIPLVLAGRDVLAGAQTGTGKTAAFVLPILQHLHAGPGRPVAPPATAAGRRQPRPPRVLVLVPTRELALQVEESIRIYGARRPVRSVPIYGGVGYDAQLRGLRSGPAVVVATPGRLLDHLGQRTVDLGAIEVLVLDEADRMLDMGFIRDIRRILAVLPADRQNLLFSATFSDAILALAKGFLRDPATVQATPRNTPTELVRQVVIRVDRERKRDLLRELVASGRVDRALVFTRTKHGASRLAEQLIRDGITAAAIHGNRSQGQRVRALDDFKAGRVSMLVATEVAARGIDVEELPHVVNYELPMVPEDYLHRIGRTGRAGSTGDAISFVCVDEAGLLRDIEALLGRRLDVDVVPGFEPDRTIRPEPIRLRTGRPTPVPARRREGPGDRRASGFRPFGPGPQGTPAAARHERRTVAAQPRSAAPAARSTGSWVPGTGFGTLPGERLTGRAAGRRTGDDAPGAGRSTAGPSRPSRRRPRR